MRTAPRTLPGIASAWAHPYPVTPWSPIFYGDGGGGDGDDKGGNDDAGKSDKDDQGDDVKTDKGSSEAEKHKALSRKWEARAKENAAAAKELEELKAANASDSEKAINEAVKKAVAEERSAGAAKLARQVFLASAAGRIKDAVDVVEDVNLSKYIDANGDVDEDGLKKLVDRLAPTSDTDDGDDDQGDGSDTRRRTRGGGYQGARRRSSSNGGGGSSLAEGAELYKSLLGGGTKT
ncbi:hypothetical protein [Streptomyces sp. NPDC087862]|uniref:hypothetical protein n=1 Tax=Streptomyces sp. NPDC087862 TaxID=3365813 RepID=UPI0038096E7E